MKKISSSLNQNILAAKRAAILKAAKEFAATKANSAFVINVAINGDNKAGYTLVRRQPSPMTAAALGTEPLYFKTGVPQDISLNILSVDYSSADKMMADWAAIRYIVHIVYDIYGLAHFKGIYAQVAAACGNIGQDKYLDLNSGEISTPEELLEKGVNVKILPSYGGKIGGQIVTSSSQKEQHMLLFQNNHDGFKSVMDDITLGMLTQRIGDEVYIAEAIKFALRCSQNASAPQFGRDVPVNVVAIYFGHYFEGRMDGICFSSILKKGYSAQTRAYTLKSQVLGVGDDIQYIMGKVKAARTIVYVRGTNPELKAEIEANLIGKSNSLAGFIVIICDDEENNTPELFGDMNSFKGSWDLDRISGLNCMKLFHAVPKKRTVTMSSQIIFKAMAAVKDDGTAMAELIGTLKSLFRKNLVEKLNFKSSTFNDVEDFINLLGDDSARALLSLDSNVADRFPWLRRNYLKNLINSLNETINKIAFQVEGIYNVAQRDMATMYGQNILKLNEVYVSDASLAGRKGVMIKWPSAGLNEYLGVTFISGAEYDSRVKKLCDAGKISVSDAKFLCEWRRTFNPAAIMVSGDERVTQTVTLDFDTDELSVIIEEPIVRFFKKYVRSVEVKIDAAGIVNTSRKKVRIDYNIMGVAQNALDRMSIQGVGTVTNAWKVIQALYLNKDLDNFKIFVQNVIGNDDKHKGTYKPLCNPVVEPDGHLSVLVNKTMVDTMVKSARNMALTDENLEAALQDFVVALPRHDQEIVIDAAKHAYDYHMLGSFKLEHRFVKFSKAMLKGDKPFELAIDDKNGKLLISGKDSPIWGNISVIKNMMTEVITEVLSDEVHRAFTCPDAVEADDEIMTACKGTFRTLSPVLKADLIRLTHIVTNIGGVYGYMKNSSLFEDGEASATYRDLLRYVENHIRRITADMEGSQRIEALIAMTSDVVREKDVFKYGGLKALARSFLTEETAEYIMKSSSKEFGFTFAANDIVATNSKQIVLSVYAPSKQAATLCRAVASLQKRGATLQIIQKGYKFALLDEEKDKELSYGMSGFFAKKGEENRGSALAELRKQYAGTRGKVIRACYSGTRGGYASAIIVLETEDTK